MQKDTMDDIETLGKKLSEAINCPLRLHMDTFICKHDLIFKVAALRKSDDWSWAIDGHKEVTK